MYTAELKKFSILSDSGSWVHVQDKEHFYFQVDTGLPHENLSASNQIPFLKLNIKIKNTPLLSIDVGGTLQASPSTFKGTKVFHKGKILGIQYPDINNGMKSTRFQVSFIKESDALLIKGMLQKFDRSIEVVSLGAGDGSSSFTQSSQVRSGLPESTTHNPLFQNGQISNPLQVGAYQPLSSLENMHHSQPASFEETNSRRQLSHPLHATKFMRDNSGARRPGTFSHSSVANKPSVPASTSVPYQASVTKLIPQVPMWNPIGTQLSSQQNDYDATSGTADYDQNTILSTQQSSIFDGSQPNFDFFANSQVSVTEPEKHNKELLEELRSQKEEILKIKQGMEERNKEIEKEKEREKLEKEDQKQKQKEAEAIQKTATKGLKSLLDGISSHDGRSTGTDEWETLLSCDDKQLKNMVVECIQDPQFETFFSRVKKLVRETS